MKLFTSVAVDDWLTDDDGHIWHIMDLNQDFATIGLLSAKTEMVKRVNLGSISVCPRKEESIDEVVASNERYVEQVKALTNRLLCSLPADTRFNHYVEILCDLPRDLEKMVGSDS